MSKITTTAIAAATAAFLAATLTLAPHDGSSVAARRAQALHTYRSTR